MQRQLFILIIYTITFNIRFRRKTNSHPQKAEGNYIPDGTASPFAAGTTHASWHTFPAPRPITRKCLHPGYRSVSPGNSESAQVRPSDMATGLHTGNVESRKHFAMLDAGGNADMARRTRREWPASNSGVQRRLRLQKCQAFRVSSLFAPAGIFVHVCRRCWRADRAGGFHVGLIFGNFSIKRKVKDYNYLINRHLQKSTISLFAKKSRTKRLYFHNHICAIRYIISKQNSLYLSRE